MRISDWSSDVCSSDLCKRSGRCGRLCFRFQQPVQAAFTLSHFFEARIAQAAGISEAHSAIIFVLLKYDLERLSGLDRRLEQVDRIFVAIARDELRADGKPRLTGRAVPAELSERPEERRVGEEGVRPGRSRG